jgi:glutamate-1-semialdehyde aminotransferase
MPVTDGKSAQAVNTDLRHLFYLGMIERGFFSASRCMYVMSTPMTQKDVDSALAAAEDLLKELKPVIEDVWPELIGRAE